MGQILVRSGTSETSGQFWIEVVFWREEKFKVLNRSCQLLIRGDSFGQKWTILMDKSGRKQLMEKRREFWTVEVESFGWMD